MMTHQGWVEIVESSNGLVLEMEYTFSLIGSIIMIVWIAFIGYTTDVLAYWGISFIVMYSFFTFYIIRKKCRQMLLQMSQV